LLRLGSAMAAGLGAGADTFVESYNQSRRAALLGDAEEDLLIEGLMRLLEKRSEWSGTMRALLDAVRSVLPASARSHPSIPADATRMSKSFVRIGLVLDAMGVTLDRLPRRNNERGLKLSRRTSVTSVTSVTTSFEGASASTATDPVSTSEQDRTGTEDSSHGSSAVESIPLQAVGQVEPTEKEPDTNRAHSKKGAQTKTS
jgi:hypothetical protein